MTGPKIEFNAEMAKQYAAGIRTSIPGYDDIHQMALSLLQCRISPAARVLVVGAGDGQEMACLKTAQPGWHLTGVDPSEEMLAVARQRLAAIGLEAELRAGTVAALPQDLRFDAATAILVMHFVKGEAEKLAFLREIAGRLTSGACYLHVELCGDVSTTQYRCLQEGWDRFQIAKGRSEQDVREHTIRRANSVHPLPAENVEKLFEEAGFTDAIRFYTAFHFNGWMMTKKSS